MTSLNNILLTQYDLYQHIDVHFKTHQHD